MTQYVNQFEQGNVKGQLDLRMNGNSMSCRANSALVAGQAVKLVDVIGGLPVVTAVTADTDLVFGFVNYDVKESSYASGDVCEISLSGNVMYMTAGATIASQAQVMYVVSTGKVITATGTTKCISGLALDHGVTDSLLRVYITTMAQARPSA